MPRPPNILWIVTTQWRAQACGYAGDPNARTPRLDAFAAHAANFVQAVTPHPFGPFARAALLTSVVSPANGVRDYYDPLPTDAVTVAHRLRDRGYTTAFFGKWHLAPRNRAAPLVGEAHARTIVPPERRGGFEVWEGFEGGFLLNDPWLQGTRLPQPARFCGYQSDVLCRRAAAWIAGRQSGTAGAMRGTDRPWFAVVSLEPPHPPYAAPAAGVAPHEPGALALAPNVPLGGDVERTARRELAGYYAHIAATDRAVGELVEQMDGETTVVVFTSVHGDMHGAHGLWRKGWPHEESVRVPLLVHVPPGLGGDAWRGRRDELVSLIDLPDWTVGWAEGRQVSIAEEAARQISMPSVVPVPRQCDRAWHGVRTHTRKLVVADTPKTGATPWLLFDLERDPWEQRNLAAEPAHEGEIASLWSLITTAAPTGRGRSFRRSTKSPIG